MTVAVTAKGRQIDDQVEPRFGRCPYFLVVDTETLEAIPLENPNLTLGGGAGIQSAQLMAEHEVKAVLTGNCGPNAYQTLKAADIEVVVGVSGTVREAVEQFKLGAFSSTQSPNVASHFGMGVGVPADGSQTPVQPMGTGMGGGMGMGRGMGGGMGRGGGRGMGMGGGGGRGMGLGGGMNAPPASMPTASGFLDTPGGANQIEALKAEAQNLDAQLKDINARLAKLRNGSEQAERLVAVVDAEKCTGCGICARACPVDAITVNILAVVDGQRCTGCGRCVTACPRDALTLKKG